MNLSVVIARAVAALPTVVALVDKLNMPGTSKKQKAIDAIPSVIGVVEAAAGADILNDPAILQLRDAAIDAQAAALKALDAYHQGLLNKTHAA